MTTRELAHQLMQLDSTLQVLVWDSKANRFRENFALSPTLFDELLITPIDAGDIPPADSSLRPTVPRNQLHFTGII